MPPNAFRGACCSKWFVQPDLSFGPVAAVSISHKFRPAKYLMCEHSATTKRMEP